MPQFKPMDPAFPIQQQIAIDAEPVVLVNVFTLAPADEADFLAAWKDDAAFMKRQPGFISTQLHRALGDSPTYLNYAIWESTEAFRAAFTHPEFVAKLSAIRRPPSPARTCSRRSAWPVSARRERTCEAWQCVASAASRTWSSPQKMLASLWISCAPRR